MREIKFRAWDISGKQMLNWSTITTGFMQGFFTDIYDVELMEFTGRYDIDEVEIFEGDIVSDEDGNHAPVIWNQEECQFVVDYQDELMNIWDTCLVIGNIYEGIKDEYL